VGGLVGVDHEREVAGQGQRDCHLETPDRFRGEPRRRITVNQRVDRIR
jgi:hypothetical protein